jgi:hypothetical protein
MALAFHRIHRFSRELPFDSELDAVGQQWTPFDPGSGEILETGPAFVKQPQLGVGRVRSA